MKRLLPLLCRLLPACLLTSSASAALPVVPAGVSPSQWFEGIIIDADGRPAEIDFALDRHSLTFFPDGASGYTYVVQPISRFPVDMSQAPELGGGTVTIHNGSFPFYGTAESGFIVSDGIISFDGSAGSNSLPGHLLRRQIAVLSSGPSLIRKLESADKLTLHFEGDTWYSDNSDITVTRTGAFQAELFFDGRIRLSYFGTAFEGGFVGLSNGNTPDPGLFVEEDFARFQLLPRTTSALESQPLVSIPVTLTEALTQEVSFAWSCHDLSAVSGADFTASSGTATIPAAGTSTGIQVALLNDPLPERGEAFLLRLSHPTRPEWVLGECEVWIVDDDTPYPVIGGLADSSPRIHRSGTKVFIEAGGSGTDRFRIVSVEGGTLSGPATGEVFGPGDEVSLAQGAQGLASSGPGLSFTVESLDAPAGNRLGVASFDIDGDSPATVFEFENVALSASEGQLATLVVKAKGPGRTVAYEVIPGNATPFAGAGGDYLAELVPLRFEHDRAIIEIPVFADDLAEGEEQFQVRLVGTGAGSFLGPDSRAVVTIYDADGPVRTPLATRAAAPTAVDEPFWSGDFNGGNIGNLEGYPGDIPPIPSNGPWINVPISEQTGSFSVTFEMVASGNPINAVVGLSENPATAFGDNSALVRASPAGIWDAYDDTGYVHGATVAYAAATTYEVTLRVDIPAGRYDVIIKDELENSAVILNQGAFRRDATVLRYLTMKSEAGTATISKIKVHRESLTVPFQRQGGDFSLGFDLRLSGEAEYGFTDVVLGLSGSSATDPANMSALVTLLSGNGDESSWSAWNGGPGGDHVLNRNRGYQRGDTYRVEFDVKVAAGTYTATLRSLFRDPDDPIVFGPFTFRAPASGIGYFHVASGEAAFQITNLHTPPRAATAPNADNTNADWINLPIPRQTGKFSISYDLRTSASPIDAISGLSASPAFNWIDVSTICRANPAGSWDGRNGTNWAAQAALNYHAGTWYRVTLDVDVGMNTYDITVTPEGAAPVRILSQATFRKTATELNWLTLRSVAGSLAIRNIGEPTAHPSDGAKQSVGKIESSLGTGSGVAVADHAVLTAARLVFDADTLSFAADVRWKFRYRANTPISAWLTTAYAPGDLATHAPGTLAADSVDVAVLSFRPLKIPEIVNAPALGGYSGFLIDPHPSGGGNPWLSGGSARVLTRFPGIAAPFAPETDLQQTSATGLTFQHLGRGVYSCPALAAPSGARGAPLFALAADGRYRPSAVCLNDDAGPARFRVVDGLIAHTIYRANLVQQIFDPGTAILLGGREWEPEAIDQSILETYGVISAEDLPAAAIWDLTSFTSYPQEPLRRSSGGKAVSVVPGIYRVQLYAADGYTLDDNTPFTIGVSAGQIFRISGDSYEQLAPTTYESWLSLYYNALEIAEPAAAADARTWLGVDHLTAYAFGFDPLGSTLGHADPAAQPPRPGFPVIVVDSTTQPPAFKIDFLARNSSDLSYTVEFSDSLDGGWSPSPVAPALIDLPGTAEWKHASLNHAPGPSPTGSKFARVRVTLDTP